MRLFHITNRANRDRILDEGFRHGHTAGVCGLGVWFADGLWVKGAVVPIGDAGLLGDEMHVFMVDGIAANLEQYRVVEELPVGDGSIFPMERPTYAEWCIPSEAVNDMGFVEVTVEQLLREADIDAENVRRRQRSIPGRPIPSCLPDSKVIGQSRRQVMRRTATLPQQPRPSDARKRPLEDALFREKVKPVK